MARIKVPFLGMSTAPTYQDGECRSIVNMRPVGGVYKPVAPRKVADTLSHDYDEVFVHRGNGYENWIGVSGNTVYGDIRGSRAVLATLPEKVNSVQQIGNTLSFVTDSNIFYALWKDGAYKYLSELPQLPQVRFKTSDKMGSISSYYVTEYGKRDVPDLDEATKGLIYKAIDKYVEEKGLHLFDAHFIRYAFRLYDGTLIRHSSPVLIMPVKNILDIKTFNYNQFEGHIYEDSRVDVYGYKIYLAYNFSFLTDWRDIIASVDFFLSDTLGLSNPEKIKKLERKGGNSENIVVQRAITSISAEEMKNLRNTSRFYFMKSVKLGSVSSILSPEEFPSNKSDISKLENLKYQELMSDDSFSHHRFGAKKSYTYNNRLRLSGITTKFFAGYHPETFMWFNTSETSPEGETLTNYNGEKYGVAPGVAFGSLAIEVELSLGVETKKVYRRFSNYGMTAIYKLFLSAFISYPDPRATRVTIYRYSDGQWYRVFTAPMEKHNALNLSYYLHDGLKPITQTMEQAVAESQFVGETVTLTELNKLKVSGINNPFVFPNETTYQIGNGKILNESSIVMNVTDRNYGMYPVFVFTETGIFTMSGQTSDAVHASIQAPTCMEPPISDVICATPYGVAFVTKRGLMMINQHETAFLSPRLREEPGSLRFDIPPGVKNYPLEPFNQYLQSIELMLYNPYQDELIIVDRESGYSYVYSFASKTFYLSTERIDKTVQNVFPEMLVIGDNNLKDFKDRQGKATQVELFTRPLRFGTEDLKKLERVFLRGVLYNTAMGASGILYSGIDDVSFSMTRGKRLMKVGNYKDMDLGLMARTKWRQYFFMFKATIDEGSEVQYVEFETDKEYDNEKMR